MSTNPKNDRFIETVPKFPGSINFTLPANALENTIYKRTNNEKDERTIIGILIQAEVSTPNSLE